MSGEALYERYKDALKRGHVASLRGRLDEALAAYAEAAAIAPERSTPHTSAGAALLRRKRPADALRQFTEALRLAPGDEAALQGRAQALAALGRRAEAADAYDTLAEVRATGGKLADAVDAARRGLELAEGRERRRVLEQLVARLRASSPEEPGRLALERALQVLDGPAVAERHAVSPRASGAGAAAAGEGAAGGSEAGEAATASATHDDGAPGHDPATAAALPDEEPSSTAPDEGNGAVEPGEPAEPAEAQAGPEAAAEPAEPAGAHAEPVVTGGPVETPAEPDRFEEPVEGEAPPEASAEPAAPDELGEPVAEPAAPSEPGEPVPPRAALDRDVGPDVDVAVLAAAAEEAVLRGDVAAVDQLLDLAAVHRRAGRTDAALDACYLALSVVPADVGLHLGLVELFDDRGWSPLAVEKLELLDRLVSLEGDGAAVARVAAARVARG
jgi:hypothetical protein